MQYIIASANNHNVTTQPSVLLHCWLGSRKGIRHVKTEWWGAGMVICLELGADLHMAQLTPLPLTISCFSKSRLVLPFWYRLTQVVPEKGPLNGCVCVCVLLHSTCNVLNVCIKQQDNCSMSSISNKKIQITIRLCHSCITIFTSNRSYTQSLAIPLQ